MIVYKKRRLVLFFESAHSIERIFVDAYRCEDASQVLKIVERI